MVHRTFDKDRSLTTRNSTLSFFFKICNPTVFDSSGQFSECSPASWMQTISTFIFRLIAAILNSLYQKLDEKSRSRSSSLPKQSTGLQNRIVLAVYVIIERIKRHEANSVSGQDQNNSISARSFLEGLSSSAYRETLFSSSSSLGLLNLSRKIFGMLEMLQDCMLIAPLSTCSRRFLNPSFNSLT